jgi:hypothetical protein
VYRHWKLEVPVQRLVREVCHLPEGGTFAVYLAQDALRRGFRARIYTCDLQLFDPSWFRPGSPPIQEKLKAQMMAGVLGERLITQAQAYMDFLDQGGEVVMREPATTLVARLVRRQIPVIAGLSCTWLYRSSRERWAGEKAIPADIAGTPTGHFVVVHGVDPVKRRLSIADPFLHRPFPGQHYYDIPIRRFFNALMLGIVTNDAKLIEIHPRDRTLHA